MKSSATCLLSRLPLRIVLASALAVAGASTFARAGVSRELVAMEDRIDGLEPAKQVDEYLKLRKLLLEKGGASSQVVLSRLALKLAFANARAANPNPDYAERLAFCRQAAEIGESHLKQRDPVRALAWEKICGGIQSRNQWASVLRNHIHKWFENRLYRRLVARDWPAARGILKEWRGLLGGDHAVDEGAAAYASARVEDLSAVLRREGADAALSALRQEEGRYPGLRAWEGMRKKAAEHLQEPFDRAAAERNVDDAEAALRLQAKVARKFGLDATLAPVEENRQRIEELVKALLPAPLHRPYGHVRAPAFRLDLGGNLGAVEFSNRDERVEESATVLTFSLDFRQRGGGRKTWYGVSAGGMSLSATEGLASGEALVLGLSGLVGVSRDRWAAWAGLGLVDIDISYTGLAISDGGRGSILGDLKLGMEYAAAKAFTLYGDLEYGGSDELSRWLARLGARYYANRNFAIGLQASAAGVKAKDDSSGAEIKGKTTAVGLNVLVQF